MHEFSSSCTNGLTAEKPHNVPSITDARSALLTGRAIGRKQRPEGLIYSYDWFSIAITSLRRLFSSNRRRQHNKKKKKETRHENKKKNKTFSVIAIIVKAELLPYGKSNLMAYVWCQTLQIILIYIYIYIYVCVCAETAQCVLCYI